MLGFDFLIKIMADGRGAAVEAERVAGAVGRINAAGARVSSTFATMGRLLGGVFSARFALGIMRDADAINDLADRTGMSIEGLQELKYAAETSGTSIEAFATALRMLAVAQSEALGGSTPRLDAFERLGVSIADLKSQNPEGLLRQISRAMSGGATTSQTIADALELMGRSADQILPAMRNNLELVGEAARKAGYVIKASVVKQLADANDQYEINIQRLKNLAAPVIASLVRGLDLFATFGKNLPSMLGVVWDSITGDAKGKAEGLNKIGSEFRALRERSLPTEKKASTAPPSIPSASAEADESAGKPNEAKSPIPTATSAQPNVDTLARIGLYRGGEPGATRRLDRIVDQQRTMIAELREVNRNLTTEV